MVVQDAILHREGVGDRDELLEKYQGFVWKIAYRFLRNTEDALDVTQEVLLRLHTHLERLEKPQDLCNQASSPS